MNLYKRLITLPDRIAMRFALAEAHDLRQELLRAPYGSDAWVALRESLANMNATLQDIGQRLTARGYLGATPASVLELVAVGAVALGALLALLIVVMA
jgi:hypothetical protein